VFLKENINNKEVIENKITLLVSKEFADACLEDYDYEQDNNERINDIKNRCDDYFYDYTEKAFGVTFSNVNEYVGF
jgi:hypothetical protein